MHRILFPLLLTLAVCGCKQQTPAKPLAQLTPQEAAGNRVFESRCSSCHYANSDEGLTGPGLQGLFRKQYLPSGMAVTDRRVTQVIVYGRAMMPPMGSYLTDQDLQDLMAYLHTL